jgi:uncharacterized membrane protein YeaQ/YmgE (transglycosylase-associated protein family)
MGIGGILAFALFGLIVGVIARFLMPGRQPMGILLTALLGIGGSLLGGWLGSQLHGAPFNPREPSSWISSVIGACLILLIYGWLQKRQA